MQFQSLLDKTQEYFSHLTREEQYGWIAEGAGFLIFVIGLFLL